MKQLFLDLDGVLADFDTAAQRLFGMSPHKAEESLGAREFWRRIVHVGKFYRDLPLMPDARQLYDAVAHLHPIILTGVPVGGWAEDQKVNWVAEHFPGVKIITCRAREKFVHLRHHGDILVDDTLKYRHLWEEAGGVFVHHVSAAETLRKLLDLGVPVRRTDA